jgi:hypothetical protein
MDEATKMIKSLLDRMERWELEGNPMYINPQNTDNKGFRRPNNNMPQDFPREQRRKYRDEQRIQTPLQNNLVSHEEGEEIDELDPEIHCIEGTFPFPYLTQSIYEESIMNSQFNEFGKGEKSKDTPNRYHLRSKKKEENFDIHDQPLIAKKPYKPITITTKEKKTQNTSPTTKELVPEVREAPKPFPSFSFEHEIQKIIILVPLSELVKNEDFKRSPSKLLQSESPQPSSDLVNLQDENTTVFLGPMV